jgi:hypothetical protein
MALTLKSQGEYYTDFQNEVQDNAPELTDFTEGSKLDILGGAHSSGVSELTKLIVDQFMKTFFDTANGPEITGGSDDLQTLAVDHFGTSFSRPLAAYAIGDVTFSRPTYTAGSVTIPIGTIVKTAVDSNGVSQRFATVAAVTMGPTTLSINASVKNAVAGILGNVNAGAINSIESALTDPTIIVVNAAATAGGAASLSDSAYREFIRNKLETLKGGTIPGIEGLAKTIAGVEIATVIEDEIAVKAWNIATNTPIEPLFRIPRTTLYIADANGSASGALVSQVLSSLDFIRAAGVQIFVLGATPLPVNWTASITLNPAGPNFSVLENDPKLILDTMTAYLNSLPIGTGFVRRIARLTILSIWGPDGTNDITDFVNKTPVGDVAVTSIEKLKPGTIGIV